MSSSKIYYLQALRGFAALWVALYHARGHAPSFGFLFDTGHYGVAIFFALSGFVIMHSISGATVTPGYWGRFMLRRSIRLDPSYWAAIVLTIGLGWFAAKFAGDTFVFPSSLSLFAHVTYLQEYLRIEQINPVFWTLTFEVQFYAFLVAMLLIPKASVAMAIMFGLACASALGLFDNANPGLFLILWGSFFAGVLARMTGKIALAGLVVLSLLLAFKDTFGLVSAITAVAMCAAARTEWDGLRQKGWQFLGDISYSLYLTHVPIIGASAFVLRAIFGESSIGQVATFSGAILASILFAAFAFYAIERPSHRFSRRVSLKPNLQHASAYNPATRQT